MRILVTTLFFIQAMFSCGQEIKGRLYLKTGLAICNFTHNNKGASGRFANGYNIGVAADLKFKEGRNITRTGELLLINKGGYNNVSIPTYDQFGQLAGTGSASFPVKLTYISASSGIRFKIKDHIYLSLSPRVDYLISFKSKAHGYSDPRTKKDFQPFTGGISYSIGFLQFNKAQGFFFELQGQNDFFKSGDRKSIGLFYNNYYGLTIGFHFLQYKDGDK